MCSVPCTRAALIVHHCTAKREDGSQTLVLSGEKKMIMSDMHQQNIKKKAVRSISVKRVKIEDISGRGKSTHIYIQDFIYDLRHSIFVTSQNHTADN